MSAASIVLSILTLLLTGTNIVTLVQLRSLRRKASYEADSVKIGNLQTIIGLQGEEIKRLSGRTEYLENKVQECGARCEERIVVLQQQYNDMVSSLRAANVKGLNL